jgi:hypothetical protein
VADGMEKVFLSFMFLQQKAQSKCEIMDNYPYNTFLSKKSQEENSKRKNKRILP